MDDFTIALQKSDIKSLIDSLTKLEQQIPSFNIKYGDAILQELISAIVDLLSSNNFRVSEKANRCLQLICDLSQDNRVFQIHLPVIIQKLSENCMTNSKEAVRSAALALVTSLIRGFPPNALLDRIVTSCFNQKSPLAKIAALQLISQVASAFNTDEPIITQYNQPLHNLLHSLVIFIIRGFEDPSPDVRQQSNNTMSQCYRNAGKPFLNDLLGKIQSETLTIQLEDIATTLQSIPVQDKKWNERMSSLNLLHALAYNHAASKFPHIFIPALQGQSKLKIALSKQFSDGRSALIKELCDSISSIAIDAGTFFEPCSDSFIDELLKIVSSTNVIMREAALSTISNIVESCPNQKIIPQIIKSSIVSKQTNAVLRSRFRSQINWKNECMGTGNSMA
ncbi:MAG: hypothetical protein EZS28_024725 [Streblomastix strix]|uniref:TOG domain-containing protein n=1 Tax=Streblomastix strix TaxID=222440 RepID=A0A5J4VAZ5_9EUKA|nr:MAG: hypothetical protein EZS28_024725 [Streblomastix strix]